MIRLTAPPRNKEKIRLNIHLSEPPSGGSFLFACRAANGRMMNPPWGAAVQTVKKLHSCLIARVGAANGRPRTPVAMASLPGGYGIRPYAVAVDARHRPGRAAAAARPAGGQWPPLQSPLGPLCEGAPPAGGGGENCTAARNISGYGKVLSLRPFGAPPSQREVLFLPK